MDVKQEPVDSYEETVIIKQESVSINPQNIIKVEEHDWASQLSATEAVPIPKQEPKVESLLANSLNEIAEVSASDYFVHTNDVVSIKRENPEFDIRVSELLTEQCDLPTIKSENIDYYNQPCSSKQAQQLSRQRKTVRKKVDKIKRKRRYPCPICRKSPSNRKHFNLHFKTYVVCGLCGRFFVRKSEFFTHYFKYLTKKRQVKNVKTLKPKRSSEINLTKNKSTSLTKHKRHNFPLDSNLKCKFCSRIFAKKQYLNSHLKSGSCQRVFECYICFNRFTANHSLKQHIMTTHTGAKLFQCEICLKRFTTKYILQRHTLMHTDKKQLLECKSCLKKLTSEQALLSHSKLHTDKDNFDSKKKISSKKELNNEPTKKHEVTKINEQPIGEYKCENCSIQFKTKIIYDQHLILNRLEKPFNCKTCSKVFTLKCHTFTHSLNNIFLECELCNQKFQGKAILSRHINEKHKNNARKSSQVKDEIDIVYNSLDYKIETTSEKSLQDKE